MQNLNGNLGLPAASDVVFQYIFSSEKSEECLLHFINAVRGSVGRKPAAKVEIRNPFNLRDYETDKKTILDIKATDEEDRTYDIEIQTANEAAFPERMLYYWAQLFANRLSSGEGYEMLRPVVSIVLTRFDLFKQLSGLHNVFNITAEENPKVFLTKHFEMHTLELTKLKWDRFMENLTSSSLQNRKNLRNWIDFLLHSNPKTEAEMETLVCDTPGLELAYSKFTEVNSDERMRELAWAREKAIRDEHGRLLFAKMEGRMEGCAEGRAEGRTEGVAIGVVTLLSILYTSEMNAELENQIMSIRDPERLNAIMEAARERRPFSEIAAMI